MRNKFKMMLLTMATLGLFSCSDKVTDNDTPSDGITDGFVVFSVNAVGNELRTARAGEGGEVPNNDFDSDYENASDEYKVTTTAGANVVYFFDSENKFVSQSNLLIMNGESDVTHPEHQTGDNDTYKEKYLKARIIKDADVNIKTGIVILNGDPTLLSGFELTPGTSLEVFMKKTQTLPSNATENKLGRYDKYFTMSNTVYLGDENLIQGPVNMEKKIKPTMEEAEKDPIQVHVERVAAKFSMTFNQENGTTSILANNIYTPENQISVKSTSNGSAEQKDWKLLINGWNVNGTETATYWVKHLYDGSNVTSLSNSNQYNDGVMSTTSFGQWKATTESGDNEYGWNDNNRLRSYWAVDPHYNATDESGTASYPQQYRTAEDGSIVSGIENSDKNVLHYIPYKNLDKTISEATYAPENTFAYATTTSDETWFKSGASGYDYSDNAYMRTSTHILVAAQLLLGDELTDQSEIADKYCYENTYWTAKDTTELKKYMVEAMIAYGSFDLYTSATDNSETSKFTLDKVDTYFDLYQPANIVGGDGRVKLTLKNSSTLYFAKAGDTNGIAVTDAALADAINVVGTAQHYNKGMMYYYIPIKHMAHIAENGDYKVGSYGVVRNHWYKVNVSAIKKPGVPVDKPDQPIVPNDDPDAGAYAAFEIVIIPWHVIGWNVTL